MEIPQTVPRVVKTYCAKFGETVKPRKTEVIVLTRHCKQNRNNSFILNGE